MSCRGQRRKAGGESRRRPVGFAFVLLVAHLAAARYQTVSASATTAIGGENGVGVVDGSSKKGGVLSRSLQEETPSPSPGADDEETPVETPTPVAETDGGETPAPEEEGGETVETPAPVPQETSVEETPTPVTEEGGASDAPIEGASETPAPVAGEEGTSETPTPVAGEGSETPAPVAGEEGTSETPTPVVEEGSETPAPVAGEEGTPETPTPVVEEGGTPETPTPVEEGTETPTPVVEEGTETPAPMVDEGPSEAPTETAAPLETSNSPTAGGSDPVATTPTPVAPAPTGTPAPYAPSTCSNGIPGVSDGDVCCLEACGQCGGVGCGAIAGTNGASDCCPDTIKEESGGVFCGEAPCVMAGFTPSPLNPAFDGTAAPVASSTCSNGIAGYQDGAICCLEICGRCGGDGCGTIPGTGGSDNCCPSDILAAGVVCGEAPCIIEGYTPAPAVVGGGTTAPYGTSTCSNGILGYQDGPACCAANCGQCGGGGCGAVPGTAGASACCSSDVELAGNLCSVTGVSPCVIDNYTPAPVVPDYGSAAPVVPSTCSNGLPGYQNNDICCLESCGSCGGDGCGTIAGTGGSAFCCPSTIRDSGVYCGNGVEAPCIIGEYTPAPANPALSGTAAPVVPTTCSNGLPGFQNGAACCKESCGACGGTGCGTIPGTGGSDFCCASDVLMSGIICGNGVEAPCVIENYTPAPMGVPGEVQPFAASVCSNGMAGVQDENICCAENCGQCGGVGCGTIPGTGGSEACCSSTIAINGTDCLDTMAAPCIIGDWVPTPSPTVFESAAPVLPSTCSNGLPGYQDGQACCLMNCGMCGGDGCGSVNGTAGASDCCPSTIINSARVCGGDIVAPCIIPATPAPTPAPALTLMPTPVPFLAGNANDFVNGSTSAADPGMLRGPASLVLPLATATAAFLGALAFGAAHQHQPARRGAVRN